VNEVVRTASEAMLTTPVRHPPSATVGELRDFFRDDHVHAALIVSPAGYVEAVVNVTTSPAARLPMRPPRRWDDSPAARYRPGAGLV
jgi:hypothetical protein